MGHIKQNPLHTIIGLVQMGIGLHLVFHDQYFTWPPMFKTIENDDIVGACFVVVGALMLWWVFDASRSVRFDHLLLIASSFFMVTLTYVQFMTAISMGADMPWISNAAITALIVVLAYRSDSK